MNFFSILFKKIILSTYISVLFNPPCVIYILVFFCNLMFFCWLYNISTLYLNFLLLILVFIQFLKNSIPFSFKSCILILILFYNSNDILIYIYFNNICASCFIFYSLNYFIIFISWLFHTTSLYFLAIIIFSCIYSSFQIIF